MGAASRGPEERRGNSSELRRRYDSSEFLTDAVSIEVRAEPGQCRDVDAVCIMYACVQYVGVYAYVSTYNDFVGAVHVLPMHKQRLNSMSYCWHRLDTSHSAQAEPGVASHEQVHSIQLALHSITGMLGCTHMSFLLVATLAMACTCGNSSSTVFATTKCTTNLPETHTPQTCCASAGCPHHQWWGANPVREGW